MKDTVHAAVHRSVHLFGEGKFYRALRLRFTRPLILDTGKTPEWGGGTPLRCHGNRGGRSSPQFAAKHAAARRGIGMLLAIQKSYELLAKYGFFAREICDKCGNVLGAVRFTRHGKSEVYCSRKCRGDAQRSATHRRGRPRKYKTDRERRAAKTRQQQVYRSYPNVEKTVRIQSETKNLQTQKVPLSYLGTPGPGEPFVSSRQA
jgi:hypothetical protein